MYINWTNSIRNQRLSNLVLNEIIDTGGIYDTSITVQLLVRDSQANFVKDPPPKYEDLYMEPPQYDENTMNTEPKTCDINQTVQNSNVV